MHILADAIKQIPAGRYIVAVSGGVDSMVLLHAIQTFTDLDYVVAHVNHGIRSDAGKDASAIKAFCTSHNIAYESTDLNLGKNASEALARSARYDFLQNCRVKLRANAILTAHHLDDAIETAIINVMRGTGWRGIAPFNNALKVMRPLENVSKEQILDYAQLHKITWREDSTNTNQKYLRNYVRLSVVPWLNAKNPHWKVKIVRNIRKQQVLRRTIEMELKRLLGMYVQFRPKGAEAQRYIWCMLPSIEAYELFQALCRELTGHSIVRNQAVAALLFIKVAKPHKCMELNSEWQLRVTGKQFIVEPR